MSNLSKSERSLELPASEKLPGKLENWGKGLVVAFGVFAVTAGALKDEATIMVDQVDITTSDGKKISGTVLSAHERNASMPQRNNLRVLFADRSEKTFHRRNGDNWEPVQKDCGPLTEYEAEMASPEGIAPARLAQQSGPVMGAGQ